MVVVRENNEDLYVGAGGFTRKGTPEEVAIQTSINTRAGVERTIRYAFDLARRRAPPAGRSGAFPPLERDQGFLRQVTLVAKTNVLTFAHDLWMRAFTEVARDYPEIKSDYQHVDACCMRMVASPERFDVIVTTNMFGDIITDLGAVLQGGMGLAASGNLNPERRFPSMFEPVHGSAPDIAGKGVANPLAAILSVAMMLDHLNQPGRGRANPGCRAPRCCRQARPALPTWGATQAPPRSATPFAPGCSRAARASPASESLLQSYADRACSAAGRGSSSASSRMLGNRSRKTSKPDDKSESDRVVW